MSLTYSKSPSHTEGLFFLSTGPFVLSACSLYAFLCFILLYPISAIDTFLEVSALWFGTDCKCTHILQNFQPQLFHINILKGLRGYQETIRSRELSEETLTNVFHPFPPPPTQIVCVPFQWRLTILLIVFINAVVCIVMEVRHYLFIYKQ